MQQLKYVLALHRVPGVGPLKLKKIIHQNPDLSVLFSRQGNIIGFSDKPDWLGVEKDLAFAQQKDCHVISYQDPYYPFLLKQIANPPMVLFVKGKLEALAQPQFAIVGTRHPTRAGLEITKNFAKEISQLGLGITSGLALGIDRAAHQGALLGSKMTVAVLANGLDSVYPAQNKDLVLGIAEKGALISEFPLGVKPRPEYFPRRNRMISGLSLGVLVVEASLKSGSLVTAKVALEQGREVFAIPGSIHSPQSKGTHALIRGGAKLVECLEDILEELKSLYQFSQSAKPTAHIHDDTVVECIDFQTISG